MIHLQKSQFFGNTHEADVATGQTVEEEGICLVSVLEGGIAKVQPSAAAAGIFAGFSITDNDNITSEAQTVAVAVPSVAPFTVATEITNILSGQIFAGALTVTENAGTAAAGVVDVNTTTGVLTFNTAEAATTATIQLRRSLTLSEAKTKYWQRWTNATMGAEFGRIGLVRQPDALVYTSLFDAAIDWSLTASRTVSAGANGVVTVGGTGPVVGTVEEVPSADSPFLGIRLA